LRGAKELRPRWQRCVAYTDANLGDALGQVYVRRVFPPALKTATQGMVQRIEDALDLRIRGLDWMSPATKAQALRKLRSVTNKIGYPDHWRDYRAARIARDDFVADVRELVVLAGHRDLEKI